MLEALIGCMPHHAVFGRVQGSGSITDFALACECGWRRTFRLGEVGADPDTIATLARAHEVSATVRATPACSLTERLVLRLREVNSVAYGHEHAHDALRTCVETILVLGVDDAADLLAWCEHELVHGDPRDERWLGQFALACNRVLHGRLR